MRRLLNFFVLSIFCLSHLNGYAQAINPGQTYRSAPTLNLLPVSQPVSHATLKGITVNPDNPLDLQFIIDTNNDKDITSDEAQVLINYFFAGLTLPESDLWVNLSPNEANRIIPDTTATTQLGEGLLSQDYLLKQLSSSLTYPETEVGKRYWEEGNSKNSLSKVWIKPNTAKIYEHNNSAFISEATLKVEMQDDRVGSRPASTFKQGQAGLAPTTDSFQKYILPLLAQQVNEGEHFSKLRQIYSALILGVWFKNKLKDSIYKRYISQSKTNGIDNADKNAKEKIYHKYLNAFKQGAYDYTANGDASFSGGPRSKRSVPIFGKMITRRYFCGGIILPVSKMLTPDDQPPHANGRSLVARVQIILNTAKREFGAMPGASNIWLMENIVIGRKGVELDFDDVLDAAESADFYLEMLPEGNIEIVQSDALSNEGLNYFFEHAGKTNVMIILPKGWNGAIAAHELYEAALRQKNPDKHWTVIHNIVCDELGTPELKFTPEQLERFKDTQNEIGAGMFTDHEESMKKINSQSIFIVCRAAVSICQGAEKGWELDGVVWSDSGVKIIMRKGVQQGESYFPYSSVGITDSDHSDLVRNLRKEIKSGATYGRFADYIWEHYLSLLPKEYHEQVKNVVLTLRDLDKKAEMTPRPVSVDRTPVSLTSEAILTKQVDRLAFEALRELRAAVKEKKWEFESFNFFDNKAGFIIKFDLGKIVIPFTFFNPPEKIIPRIYGAFRSKKEVEGQDSFSRKISTDVRELAEYLSDMISHGSPDREEATSLKESVRIAAYKPPKQERGNHPEAFASTIVAHPLSLPSPQMEGMPANIYNALTRLGILLFNINTSGSHERKSDRDLFEEVNSLYREIDLGRREADEQMKADLRVCKDYFRQLIWNKAGVGGTIGRWGYTDIKYDPVKNTVTLINPYRIANKNGEIEPEFAQYDKSKVAVRPDIVLNTKSSTAYEDGTQIEGLRVVFLEDDVPGVVQHHPGYYRINGIGDPRVEGVIFIRRALWDRVNKDPKYNSKGARVELLTHEYLHYHGKTHDDARRLQTNFGLRGAIRAQGRADKKTYAMYYKNVNGGIDVTDNAINLQTTGKGNDFKITADTDLNYTGLTPRVVSLSSADFSALLPH